MDRHRGVVLRWAAVTVLGLAAASLAGCGGGSGSSGYSGGSGSSSSSSSSSSPTANVAPIVVDCGPSAICSTSPVVNTAYVTVTICQPGSTTSCQTFDHIQVDTQSYGLRILASATDVTGASPNVAFYPAINETQHNLPLAECAVFADGYSWGPVVSADVDIAGESAPSVPVQIIGDTNPPYGSIPSDCTSAGAGNAEDSVTTFGANGILGVGVFVADCGPGCAPNGTASPTYYYVCSPSSDTCADSTVDESQQVSNPVYYFQTDNNGVIVELPAIPAGGEATVTGSLVFGIGTEGNNGLGPATVFQADPSTGTIDTLFNGQSLTGSILDSGSNGLFFDDSSINQCTGNFAGFYCPASTVDLSATISSGSGGSGASTTVYFSVANAQSLNGSYAAFDDLAGPLTTGLSGMSGSSGVFDWGLPFFFGRNVFTAIDNANTPAGVGPYYAF